MDAASFWCSPKLQLPPGLVAELQFLKHCSNEVEFRVFWGFNSKEKDLFLDVSFGSLVKQQKGGKIEEISVKIMFLIGCKSKEIAAN